MKPSARRASPTSWRGRLVSLYRSNKEATSQSKAASSLGWRFVRLHPSLFMWRFLSTIADQILTWTLLAILFAPFVLSVLVTSETELFSLLAMLLQQALSTTYLIGLSGVLASMLLITWLIDAWTRAATWLACARLAGVPASDTRLEARPLFSWSEAVRYIPDVLRWSILRKLVLSATLVAGLGLYIQMLQLVGLEHIPAAVKFAAYIFLYLGVILYLLLVFGTLEWYPARWMTRHHRAARTEGVEQGDDPIREEGLLDAGEALLESARRILEYPTETYQLFLHVLRPAIPFLVLSLCVDLVRMFFLDQIDIYNLLTALKWLADLGGVAALIGVAMAFRFGSAVLEVYWTGVVEAPLLQLKRQRLRHTLLRQNRHNPLTKLLLSQPSNPEHLEAQHLLSPHTPYRFDFEHVLAAGERGKEDEEHS